MPRSPRTAAVKSAKSPKRKLARSNSAKSKGVKSKGAKSARGKSKRGKPEGAERKSTLARISPIELYYWPTPNGWKISIMLEECGLPYVMRPVDISKGEQ